jgi:hypothetical protein
VNTYLGDSHAEHLFPGLAEAWPTKNIAYYIQEGPPFIDQPEYAAIYEAIRASKSIHTVLLTAFWQRRSHEVPNGSTLEQELTKIVDALEGAGKKVHLLESVPTFPFSTEKCKGSRWLSTDQICEITSDAFQKQSEPYSGVLNNVARKRLRGPLIDVSKYVCGTSSCSMARDGKILYRDDSHLNLNGSLLVGRQLAKDHPSLLDRP